MLKNKYAIVTGASDGIGYAIAEIFARNGANVCIIGRDSQKLELAKKQLSVYNTEVIALACDLSQMTQLVGLTATIKSIFPQVDVLVNNAGIGRFIPFAEMDEEALDMHLNLNVKTPYLLTKYLLDSLVKSQGNVINISSYFANRMLEGRDTTAYSLTKGALDSFTKSLAFEIGKQGVRVNGIAPGSIRTPQLETNLGRLTAEGRDKFHAMVKSIYPLGAIGSPDDVAQAALFLASDGAKWVTGTIMAVDGGLTTN